MKLYKGIGASQGMAVGAAWIHRVKRAKPERRTIQDAELEAERLSGARMKYREKLQKLMEEAASRGEESAAEILDAYMEIVDDDVFFKKVTDACAKDACNAEYALEEEKKRVCEQFMQLENEYLRARAEDIVNVCDAVNDYLMGSGDDRALPETGRFILVADTLSPADTMHYPKNRLLGMVTYQGGLTSHTVILAKSLGIPAIVGVKEMPEAVKTGETMAIDGESGEIVAGPDEATMRRYERAIEEAAERRQIYDQGRGEPAVLLDGGTIAVNINTGDPESMELFRAENCDGIGLFRTEFLYLHRTEYPSEEDQLEVYREIARRAEGKEVIIRTLDIGGDKQVDYMDLPRENNPFLGFRAIRLCLDRPKMFHKQLRAIIRASVSGNLKIMVPMVIGLREVEQVRRLLDQVKDELRAEGIPFDEHIPLGVMIETPAAVMVSDMLAREVDFFSIGTNDLTQYIMAADRMNDKVQHLYDIFDPAVLRAIRLVAESAHAANIPVGICGEAAGEPELVALWAALGIDELSVVPNLVGQVKHTLRHLSAGKMKELLGPVFEARDGGEARRMLEAALEAVKREASVS